MMMGLSFKEQLDFIINKVASGENFSLSRYGDGELAIIEGREIGKETQAYEVDGWHTDGNAGVFAEDLRASLNREEENFFYGIPCVCCHGEENKNKYIEMINNDNILFANLLVNANFRQFVGYLLSGLEREVVLIANEKGRDKEYPFNVVDAIWVKEECIEWYNGHKKDILASLKDISEKHSDTLFLVAAGPLANIMVDKLYEYNPNNTYLDIGSPLDVFTKGVMTRPYQDPNTYFANLRCTFDPFDLEGSP